MGSVFEIMNSGNTFRVDHAQWEGNNTVRNSSNKRMASDVALKEFSRTLGNQRRVSAAGEEYNVATANLGKVLNQTTVTNMNLVEAAAQTEGSLAAQAAALGVGGQSVDLINKATELQRNMQQDMNSTERDSAAVFGSKANAQLIDNAWKGIDNSTYLGNFDHSSQMEPRKLKNKWGAMIAVGFATFFGGGQAGAGMADGIMGANKQANGKFDEANQYFGRSAQEFAAAYKETASLQDDSGDTKSYFQAIRDRNSSSQQAKDASSKGGGAGLFNWWGR